VDLEKFRGSRSQYTKVDAKCDQQVTVVGRSDNTSPRPLSSTGVVNNIPTTIASHSATVNSRGEKSSSNLGPSMASRVRI